MKKYKVGDTVHVVECGNLVGRREAANHYDKRIIRVGRKYFYIRVNSWEVAFHIDSGNEKTDYSANYRVVESEQAFLDEKAIRRIARQIYDRFEYGRCKYSLAQLKAVAETLDLEG